MTTAGVTAIEQERAWREERVERLRLLATRPEGLSDQQAEELDYTDGVRFGLDLALMILRGDDVSTPAARRVVA